jgi:hydroxypyruvate isomerase
VPVLSFSANLSMLFTEVSFVERFAKAATTGFRGVECQFPYAYDVDKLAEELHRHDLVQVLHNLPAGDWANGERGIACLPDRVGEFQDGVRLAIEYATALSCARINCIAGVGPVAAPQDLLTDIFVNNLRFAARELKNAGIMLLIEPLNTRDVPGFFLQTTRQALDVIRQVGSDNLYLQYDVYHMDIMEGDVAATIQRSLHHIRHVQIADNPGRHEPGTGAIDYPSVFSILENGKYGHWIGCEYNPLTSTEASLRWMRAASHFADSASNSSR